MEGGQGPEGVVTAAKQWAEALDDCHMNFVRPYVNQMLKKHPLGKEFRIIRELILHHQEGRNAILISLNNVIDYQGPYKGTYQGPYRNFYVNKFFRIIFSCLGLPPRHRRNYRRNSVDIDRARRCAEEATRRAKLLLKYLDQSKDSQWIVTYMLEDPLKRVTAHFNVFDEESPYYQVINMFEGYLKDCQP